MSTIDIGIAEIPARPVVTTPQVARPAVRVLVSPSTDFYVGSVKLEAAPPPAPSAPRRLQEPVC